jgi:tetratricopeptide (TPR) repeat protein
MTPVLLLALSLLIAPDDKLADARAQLEAGQTRAAVTALSAMLKAKEGDEHAVRLLLAEAQIADGAPEAALTTLEPVDTKGDAPALRLLGRAFRANGDKLAAQGGRKADDAGFMYEQAADSLGRAADAGDTAAGVEAGFLQLYNLGDSDGARKRADKVLEKDPQNGEALLLRGCALVNAVWAATQAKDEAATKAAHDKAVADLLAADTALGGKRFEPAYQLSWLYEQANEPDKAVKYAADWCDRLPEKDFSLLYRLARRYAGERRWVPASSALLAMAQRDVPLLGTHLKAEDDPGKVAVELSWSIQPLMEAQRARPAKDILAALSTADPQDADFWNNYGLIARDVQAYEESWRAYEKGIALRPEDANLLNDGAVIIHYYLHRDYDKAQEMYEKSIEIATELLKSPDKLTPEQKANAEKAKTEATNNMANLAKGVYEWRG